MLRLIHRLFQASIDCFSAVHSVIHQVPCSWPPMATDRCALWFLYPEPVALSSRKVLRKAVSCHGSLLVNEIVLDKKLGFCSYTSKFTWEEDLEEDQREFLAWQRLQWWLCREGFTVITKPFIQHVLDRLLIIRTLARSSATMSVIEEDIEHGLATKLSLWVFCLLLALPLAIYQSSSSNASCFLTIVHVVNVSFIFFFQMLLA